MAEIADPKLIAALNRIAAAIEAQNDTKAPEASLGDVTYGARLVEKGPIPLAQPPQWITGEGDWTLQNDDKVGED